MRRRVRVPALAALAVLAPCCALLDPVEAPRPFQRLEFEPETAWAGLRAAQRRVEASPEDVRGWHELAAEAFARGRRTYDPAALGLAQDAFARALSIERSGATLFEAARLAAFRLRHEQALALLDAASAAGWNAADVHGLREQVLELAGRGPGVLRDAAWKLRPGVAEVERVRAATGVSAALQRCAALLHEAEDVDVRVLAARWARELGRDDESAHHRRSAESYLRRALEAGETCGLQALALLLAEDPRTLDEALELARRNALVARSRQALMLVETLELRRSQRPRTDPD